jgi:uncharacterized protein (DUF4213/DUF364 family)
MDNGTEIIPKPGCNPASDLPILKLLLDSIADGEVLDVRIGLHWTAVVVEVSGERRCGLASTLFSGHGHHEHRGEPDVPSAGKLEALSAKQLANESLLDRLTRASVGIAALNALLPRDPQSWVESNAEDIIAQYGDGKRVVIVGRFPFVPRLADRVGELLVLEQQPGPDDLPAEAAPSLLPGADVVAITGMTLANHTLDGLLSLCSPEAFVLVLGPSTPLSPLLFNYGVDVVSGAVVTDIDPVLRHVSQGANFRQVHRAGVLLVNIFRPGLI